MVSGKGGLLSMPEQMVQTINKIRGGFDIDGHINVTQLGRSTEWRRTLQKLDALQVLDRNKTAAVLLSKEAYTSLMKYIDNLEIELEQARLEQLLIARENMEHWETGERLSRKAEESFLERYQIIRGLLDGENVDGDK